MKNLIMNKLTILMATQLIALVANAHVTDATTVGHLPAGTTIELVKSINLTPQSHSFRLSKNRRPTYLSINSSDQLMGCYLIAKEAVNFERLINFTSSYGIVLTDSNYDPDSHLNEECTYGWNPYDVPSDMHQVVFSLSGSNAFSELRCFKYDAYSDHPWEITIGDLKIALKEYFIVNVPNTTVETN